MSGLPLVDDDPVFRRLLGRQLEALGHLVTVAEDGQEGLHRLQAATAAYDLLITDLNMPRVSGRELVAAVRSDLRWGALPIIIVSATSESGGLGDYLRDGITRFMAKPVDFFGISASIAHLCNRRITEFIELTPEEQATLAQATAPPRQ